jgi:hypothetical protein
MLSYMKQILLLSAFCLTVTFVKAQVASDTTTAHVQKAATIKSAQSGQQVSTSVKPQLTTARAASADSTSVAPAMHINQTPVSSPNNPPRSSDKSQIIVSPPNADTTIKWAIPRQ